MLDHLIFSLLNKANNFAKSLQMLLKNISGDSLELESFI